MNFDVKEFDAIHALVYDCAEMLRPPERMSVSDAAAKYRHVNSPGAYVGPWLNSKVPYMREPMDVFASSDYTGMVFVGPAQCGKTDSLIINTILYSVIIDPMDMMIVCPTNTAARDFSMRRVDRLNTYSDQVGKLMMPGSSSDNTFDKQYRNGMILSLSWPTTTELAGKPIGRVILTDRDRMDDDVGGDGEPYDLSAKRTTTYKSNAMTVAESSPSREVIDMKWIPKTAHEAPPCNGIIGLYNRGDRRRWYWPCPNCDHYFEGKFTHLQWERKEGMSNLDAGDTARLHCPACDHAIHPDERHEMNIWGMWVRDGEAINRFGKKFGKALRSKIASFWLRGVAASFVNWKELVVMYLDAEDSYERTGSEDALKKFYNNDLGEPYMSKASMEIRLPEAIKARAEPLAEKKVPMGVRFLEALIDVQKGGFAVQVNGILPGAPFDMVMIDRFHIVKSKRKDDDGDPLPVRPHSYLEDWKLIVEQVMQKEYELDDGSGRTMAIKITGCDSGGKEGVTSRAYDFWRWLTTQGLHQRFVLLKGEGKPGQPRARVSFPDSGRKDNKSAARGDVPVLMLNSNMIKDDLDGRLDCIEPGKGMYRFPDWLPIDYYNELCSEVRTDKGWERTGVARNEAWDLSYYAIGLAVSAYVRVEAIDWSNPPSWASEWDTNDFVRVPQGENAYETKVKSGYDFAGMAQSLA
jgi:phage terminase large subunit GpA-like protein